MARYAVNMAAHHPDRRLVLVQVGAPGTDRATWEESVARLCAACAAAGVKLEAELRAAEGDVFQTLVRHVPPGPETLVLCGARIRPKGRGFLAGTVSEKLLKDTRFPVMALRVVQPGLLGAPHELLAPVAGDLVGWRAGADILKLLAPGLRRVHLLMVMTAGHALRRPGRDESARLRAEGWRHVERIEAMLLKRSGLERSQVDVSVRVARDWAREVALSASRLRAQLVVMEVSRRYLARPVFADNPLERVLRDAPCDVAIYRGVE